MFEVGTSVRFRAFHRMPDEPPPENELHEHDYRVDVVAERERLDARGMVCDLDAVNGALGAVADRVRDRDLAEACGSDGMTVELLASWTYAQLEEPIGSEGAEVLSVRVWESADAFGGIRGSLR
jgi:6-pyruvoyl-tetrahydropterin synthase